MPDDTNDVKDLHTTAITDALNAAIADNDLDRAALRDVLEFAHDHIDVALSALDEDDAQDLGGTGEVGDGVEEDAG